MYFLYVVTLAGLLISFFVSREKTVKSVKIALQKLKNILPAFLSMLILVSIILFLIPDDVILKYIGNDNKVVGIIVAAFFGSITLMPGFIAYPLCGILLKKGVTYMVLSAFSTTLMMVGVLTYPIEKAYFGTRVTLMRNLLSLFIAVVVALMTGIFFGEML